LFIKNEFNKSFSTFFQDGGSQGSGGQTDMASSVEAEIYLTSVVQATPRAMIRPDSAW
jgi:hypothetical protein